MSEYCPYRVQVEAEGYFLADQSDEDEKQYAFAYRIRLHNQGSQPAKLLARHWVAHNLETQEQEVMGEGDLSEHPTIDPGQTLEYMSGAMLEFPIGTISGSYLMRSEDGTEFSAQVPEFLLSVPRILH